MRDSWRLSTGEKAEVVHGFLKYLFVLVFNIKLIEVEELIETERRRRRRETVGEGGEVSIVTTMTMPYDLLRAAMMTMWMTM